MKRKKKTDRVRFSYCLSCGKRTLRVRGKILSCEACGLKFYHNIAAATAAILLNEKGEILFVKRNIRPRKGYLDLPGGFVDAKESLEEGICREIQEELGMRLRRPQYFFSASNPYSYAGITYQVVSAIFIARVGRMRPSFVEEENSAYLFIKAKDIPLSKIAFSSLQKALREYQKKFL